MIDSLSVQSHTKKWKLCVVLEIILSKFRNLKSLKKLVSFFWVRLGSFFSCTKKLQRGKWPSMTILVLAGEEHFLI